MISICNTLKNWYWSHKSTATIEKKVGKKLLPIRSRNRERRRKRRTQAIAKLFTRHANATKSSTAIAICINSDVVMS